MNWEKLNKKQYYNEPVEHIHAVSLFDNQRYDSLYENQSNLDHRVWQEFDKMYKVGFEFKDDITKIDFNKAVIALWFFKERADRNAPPHIDLSGKLITYTPNTFILTKSKDIQIKEAKRRYIRRPMVQLDISENDFDNICGRFK
tara:strand:- start:320 stop:751 length:432 start_codon:yes stop_codon:yes gene_type:complete